LALAALATLYRVFDLRSLLVLCVTLLILCLIYNIRFDHTGLNLLFIAATGLLANWGLLQNLNFRTDDAERFHFFRLNELDYLLRQGVFYPRWASDFAYGHGSAEFNFYAPLSRYLGEVFVLVGLPPAFALHAVLLGTVVLGAFGIYFLARQYLGGVGSVVAAVAYLYNPYQLANFYQRGSLAESVAFAFMPYLMLALNLLMKLDYSRKKALLLGAVAYTLILCSHQLTAFLTLVFLIVPYTLLNLVWLLYRERKAGWKQSFRYLGLRVFWVGTTLGMGIALAAFFILPAFLESPDIWLSQYVRYRPEQYLLNFSNAPRLTEWVAHIEKIKDPTSALANLSWIGISHLILAFLGLLFSLFQRANQKSWPIIVGIMLGLMLTLQLGFTAPFWQTVPYMRFIEFPWRLMIFAGLFTPLLIGIMLENGWKMVQKERPLLVTLKTATALLIMGLVAWTGGGNIVLSYNPADFDGWYSQATVFSHVGDVYYLPIQVGKEGLEMLDATPDAYSKPYAERDNKRVADPVIMEKVRPTSYRLTVELSEPAKAVIPVFYFPGWKLKSGSEIIPISFNQPLGFITAQLPAGSQTLELTFEDTPIRSIGVAVSVVSGLILVAGLVMSRRKPGIKKG
jgi:hypothetical protein